MTDQKHPFSLTPPNEPMRLAKAMARAGVASRRESERFIEQGIVSVNGDIVTSPALNVTPDDDIMVAGKPLPKAEGLRLFLYHKPAGLLTTNARDGDRESDGDTQERPTIYDKLPKTLPRVISVGRLDINSEGLLLLTNDGDFARYLELPETGLRRTYRVRVRGRVDREKLDSVANGVTIDGVRYGKIGIALERQQGSNAWLIVTLHEGKNREIRRVMDHLGYPVNRLIRKSYGSFHLNDLQIGDVTEVSTGQLRKLLDIPHKGVKAKPKKSKPRPAKKGTGAKGTKGAKGKKSSAKKSAHQKSAPQKSAKQKSFVKKSTRTPRGNR